MTLLFTLKGHKSGIQSLVKLNENNQTILASASYDSTIRLWNSSNGSLIQTLEGHKKYFI
jgi:WD40 repeat protein